MKKNKILLCCNGHALTFKVEKHLSVSILCLAKMPVKAERLFIHSFLIAGNALMVPLLK